MFQTRYFLSSDTEADQVLIIISGHLVVKTLKYYCKSAYINRYIPFSGGSKRFMDFSRVVL